MAIQCSGPTGEWHAEQLTNSDAANHAVNHHFTTSQPPIGQTWLVGSGYVTAIHI